MVWPRGVREAVLALIVATGVLELLSTTAVLRGLETASLDLRFRARGVQPPGTQVAVILVDDRSLAALGRWPFSRRLFARAVETLDRAGAKLIVFDLLFAEPDQSVPIALRDAAREAVAALPSTDGSPLRAALTRLADDDPDRDFATAIRASGKVLMPVAFAFGGAEVEGPAYLAEQSFQRLDASPVEPVFPLQPRSVLLPVPALAEAAAGFGHVTIAYDRDGAPRYDYVALQFNGDFLPSLPVRAAAAYFDLPWPEVGIALGAGARLGSITVPTDPAMRLVVNYRGPRGTIPTYSFVDFVEGKIPADRLAGRAVLIGASFIGIADTNPAPFGNTPMPGTERMANIIASILDRDFILESPPPWSSIVLGLVMLLALLIGIATALLPTRIAALVGAVPVLAWCGGAQIAFLHGLWLPLVNPVAALAAAVLSTLLFRYGLVDQQRRRIQAAFRHYLAPDLVNALAAHPERLRLGGETRTVTLMFSDIRGFTSIAEQFKSNPQALTHLINRGFLTPMTALIMARQGTIDKYIGDCVMAFWNAPLDDPEHSDHACATALAMIKALDRINLDLKAEAEAEHHEFHTLRIGIGINTGECVIGNMGSDERFAYTAMGDAVNLASRLEGQTKTYNLPIILGEATRRAAPSWAALELDLIEVKGRHEPARIYGLVGDAALAASASFRAHAERHERLLACYRAQDWAEARAALCDCRGYDEGFAAFYDLYEQRIAYCLVNPPGPTWDGVFVAETK